MVEAFWLLFRQTWWWVIPTLTGLWVYHRSTRVPEDPPPTPEVLLPDLAPEWKIVRHLADAFYQATDNAMDELFNVGLIPADADEEAIEFLSERLYTMAATGKDPIRGA